MTFSKVKLFNTWLIQSYSWDYDYMLLEGCKEDIETVFYKLQKGGVNCYLKYSIKGELYIKVHDTFENTHKYIEEG